MDIEEARRDFHWSLQEKTTGAGSQARMRVQTCAKVATLREWAGRRGAAARLLAEVGRFSLDAAAGPDHSVPAARGASELEDPLV
jgi:hypothetical protein